MRKLSNRQQDMSILAVLYAHNRLIIWDTDPTKKFQPLQTIQCDDPCVIYSGDIYGKTRNDLQVVVGTAFAQILVWSIKSQGRVLKRFQGHNGPVHSVQWNPNGTFILSGSEDRTLRLWNLADE